MDNKIEVTVAKSSGFCFGVARAAKFVESEIENASAGERIFTLGHLIHNDTYNSRLASRGVGVISGDEIEKIAESATESSPVKVFVRAHGITRETEELLVSCQEKNKYFSFVDCTCVFVKKIHKIVHISKINTLAKEGEKVGSYFEIFKIFADIHKDLI